MTAEIRNYNQGRVKELIENALRESAGDFHIATCLPPPHKFKEFDILPENRIFNDFESITVKYYDTENGEVISFCVIRERYLKRIHDGELTDRKHEYNLFKKYAEFVSREIKEFSLSKFELICAENCTCRECLSDNPENNSEYQNELSKYDNPHYNSNLDNDQQSAEFWNNI